ncbi:hypothetical protein HRD49_08135 [Corallococcus exiguus]|uniref:hypothetical protein n=1 Tax=Corallococcus exiguus TaxID=83462 RepID=UPI0010DD3944|nr:hypothetical protein [Corallococcus exiguus]NRD61722.1 hypothetical protein [Corallococcus exiguus]RYZ41487.1 MAG: hypothetical protein EOO71_11660 [Myxococcaceae bacterium]
MDDTSRTGELLPILVGKFESAMYPPGDITGTISGVKQNQRPELTPLYLTLMTVHDRHRHTHRMFLDEKLTDPGMLLIHLKQTLSALNPEPQEIKTSDDLAARWDEHQFSLASSLEALREKLYSPTGGSDVPSWVRSQLGGSIPQDEVEQLVSTLRPITSSVHEDLIRRIGTRRTLIALLHRFKERCEWHDRDRLRGLAARSKRPEDALTAELARWLFDQGLSPITRPMTGGLQPDLLDPAVLYIEAKRYRDNKNARRHIVQGTHELYDVVARLKGTKYNVTEAFYVIFREGGPQFKLPEVIPGDGWVTLPVVIDIAPLTESGSRQKNKPIELSEDELGPT